MFGNEEITIMIKLTQPGTDGFPEVLLSGKVTQADYDTALIPAIDKALETHDALRMLVITGPDFAGYDAGAAWADTKLGLTHWRGFDRLAVATDTGWIATGVRAMSPIMPCPVQVFALAETESARRWLRESLGAVHVRDLGGPALHIQLLGRPNPEDFKTAEADLDARLRERDGFRLLLDLRDFDGWQGLAAIAAHFNLAREHAPLVERAAIVGDQAWQHMAQKIASRFLKADVTYFPASAFDQARHWLTDS